MLVPSPLRPVAGVSLDALAEDPARAAGLPAEIAAGGDAPVRGAHRGVRRRGPGP